MKILFLIPARAGSKGLPGKNTKILGNKPLICYTIDFVLDNIKATDELCISTNDDEVIRICNELEIIIPFKRPEYLSTDNASSQDVILHALSFYSAIGKEFDAVMLLQPTSPFRLKEDFRKVIEVFSDDCEMAVSVNVSKDNPYFNLFEENGNGFLSKSKKGDFKRRQDCPDVYAFNGSIYLIRISALKNSLIGNFTNIKKVKMPNERSIDIDTLLDWNLAEFYLNK